jgi:hypothetical protein
MFSRIYRIQTRGKCLLAKDKHTADFLISKLNKLEKYFLTVERIVVWKKTECLFKPKYSDFVRSCVIL